MTEKSILRKLIEQGNQVSLGDDIDDKPIIISASGKPVPNDWLKKHEKSIAQGLRHIKKIGLVTTSDAKEFFDDGGKLPQEQSTDEWVSEYEKTPSHNEIER